MGAVELLQHRAEVKPKSDGLVLSAVIQELLLVLRMLLFDQVGKITGKCFFVTYRVGIEARFLLVEAQTYPHRRGNGSMP